MPRLRKKRVIRSQESDSSSSSDEEINTPPAKRRKTTHSQDDNNDETISNSIDNERVQASGSEEDENSESEEDFQYEEEEEEEYPLQFRRGSITRVRVRNFMTYDDAEFHPGPRLNLILGPNGTGKSSFVNALCIGLAGNPRLLGRATDAKSYIKQGKDRASVEIELSYDSNRTIQIGMNITHRETKWKINDQPAKKSSVTAIIKKLNIRLDNLTQFLPQDRVAHFAGLSPIQLLQETQEAVLDASVAQDYKELCKIRSQHKGSTEKLEQLQKKLDRLRKANEMLEADVERFKKRKAHLKKAELLKIKVAYARATHLQGQLRNLRAEVLENREKAKEKRNKEMAIKKEKDTFQAQFQKLEDEKSSLLDKLRALKQQLSQYKKQLEKLEGNFVNTQEGKKHLHKNEKDREKKIEKYQQLIQQRKTELNELTPKEDLDQQLKEKQSEIHHWHQKKNSQHYKTAELESSVQQCEEEISRSNARLKELENYKYQRIQLIQQIRPQVYKAYKWISQNKHRFAGDVAIPALEVDIKENEFGKYLEKCIPDRILFGLVCSHDKDRELLIEELTHKQQLSRLTILLPKEDHSSNDIQRIESLEDLQTYGIKCFLDQTFQTPSPVVKDVLVRLANLSQIAIGTRNTEYCIDSLFNNTRIRMVCTPNKRYNCVTSRYDPSVKSSGVIQLQEPQLFTSAYSEEIEQLREQRNKHNEDFTQLSRQLNANKEEERQLYQKIIQLNSEKNKIDQERKKHNKILSEIESREFEINSLKEQNYEQELAAKDREIRDINRNRFNSVKSFSTTVTRLLQMSRQLDVLELCSRQFNQDDENFKQQLQEVRSEIVEIESRLKEQEKEYSQKKQELLNRKKKAEELRDEYAEKHNMETDQVKEELTELSDDVGELREEAQREQAEADAIYHDPELINQYERRKEQIEGLSQELEEYQRDKESDEKKMIELKKKWLKPLRKCVKQIDREFIQFTKNLGIEGRVELGEEGDEYDKYRILIKVKFREGEDLAPLDAQRQSGGERSVSTILYLLSLQRLNKCPFRVVDEINQGMDPNNERAIFNEILRCSKGKNTPQCFLITPKLLSNLVPPDRNITVLFIYNGIGNLKQEEWEHFRQQFQQMIADDPSSSIVKAE
eukprot:gb/GECH01003771.1/.p1 GENE.gb/GECH01003771.1/~~gb/GECH01003771.1/.p1  ORF type:complete len:1131 (+),score=398.05 gb/GECH01003771.1/:1-3393(+)